MSKRKHVTLKLQEKISILKMIDRGESYSKIATEFGIGKATVSDIKKNRANIMSYYSTTDEGPADRKTLKLSSNPAVEKALFTWFLQERTKGTPISGNILCEKAKFFYKNITGKDDFKASTGWLQKFKKRFGIRQLTVCGESLSSDLDAVLPFIEKLRKVIQERKLTPDQVYNADESGLFLKMLPSKTLAHSGEKSAPGMKISKERITFMPCSNASGSHKLKLLVLGKSLKPRAFGNFDIPVSYKGQKRAWVTKEIFSEWFHSEFVPSVRGKMRELNLSPKALLLLDNAPGHPTELSSDDDQISVMFLPPKCTPLLQPMDQHVIQAIKLFYRKSLLQQVVESEDPIPQTLKSINLKHVVLSLDNAWKNVSTDLIKKSWSKVWPSENITEDLSDEDDEDDIPLARLAKKLAEVEKIPEIENDLQVICSLSRKLDENLQNNEIEEWVFERNEPSDMILTDESIIQEQLDDIGSDSSDEECVNLVLVKHGEAVLAFDKCIQWATQNNISENRLALLNELRGRSLTLERESMKQMKITIFLPKYQTMLLCN